MPSAESLRKEAERKRVMARSVEEKEHANELRQRAQEAEARSEKYAKEAQSDDAGEIVAGVVMVALVLGGLVYLFGG